MTTTNKFGDMLRELRDPQTPEARVNEIARLFNEFSDRELRYKRILENNPSSSFIQSLHLGVGSIDPDGTILSPFVAEKKENNTDTTITTATFTYVTFNNNKYGNNRAFRLSDDNQKIFILTKAKAVFLNVAHAWQSNTTGSRRVDVEYYTSTDAKIGTAILGVVPTSASGDETWFTNGRLADFPDQTDYIKCRVYQNSGGDLHLVYYALDLHLI